LWLVVGLRVPYLHKYTVLPGCFSTGEFIHSSLAPFFKTVEKLWQQFKNEKSASDRHSTGEISCLMDISGTAISSLQQRFETEALSKCITSPALQY